MDHCKDSENVIMHSILCVKLEPFDEDEDCTQNLDPLQPDSDVHTQMELFQDFKTEIESDCSDQTMNELIQGDILKNDPGDTGTKIEEVNINTEYIGNEAGLDDILASHGIIEGDSSVHNQLSEKNASTNTDEKNTTTYELSHSCETHRSDVEQPTNDGSSLNVTSPVNHYRARSDTCSSVVDVLGIHKPSTSEEGGSKHSSSLIALRHYLYVCDECGMSFENSRNLVSHKVVHTDQKQHVCDVCKKGFSNSYHLVRHKRIHTGQTPYACDICKKGFSDSSNLVAHKRTHYGQKSFVCGICKKGFSRPFTLARHKRIHTGQKPYTCDICEKRFGQLSALVTHKRIHTDQKPYVCEICKKGFSDLSALVTHKRMHTGEKPYICNICKKGFSQSSALVTHKRIHTGQKPFVCDICKKGFTTSSNLVTHTRIHTGEKPYVCDICKNGFIKSSNLTAHKRSHYGQNSSV